VPASAPCRPARRAGHGVATPVTSFGMARAGAQAVHPVPVGIHVAGHAGRVERLCTDAPRPAEPAATTLGES
jgi:hypothetical protein